jgi:Alcohol dehydrogenase transcription factor Myb/SANT-like
MAPKSILWTSEKEELLISFVEARPCLWNPKDKDYFKTEYKNFAFDECAQLQLGKDFTGK